MTCFTLASLNRSNCVLLGIYFIFDLIELTKNRKFVKAICFPLLSGSLMFSALLYQQYYLPYKTFCPQRGEWCKSQLFSSIFITKTSLYSYIQSHYWGVGLLKYWTPNNIPNFLFAVPNIIILIYSSIYFSKIYPSYNLKALVWITRALVVIVCFFAHVQILNRIASFLPLHLWYLADRLVKTSDPKKMENPKGDDKIVKFYIYWLAFWIPLQTILFAAFFTTSLILNACIFLLLLKTYKNYLHIEYRIMRHYDLLHFLFILHPLFENFKVYFLLVSILLVKKL
ncbi:Gpi18p [Saccharomyces cerevisiae FostersB]|nr:Gpi18p [Saccharomyces cerevisiae FostersB]